MQSKSMVATAVFSGILICGCGGGSASGTAAPGPAAAVPTVATAAARNGAVVVTLAAATPGATIYYSVDGSAPSISSRQYFAPFLVASNLTVKAIATVTGGTPSAATSQTFAADIPSGALVWSEEFNPGVVSNQPNPRVWTYDTGNSGFGNQELENYCGFASAASPCDATKPNAIVGIDGKLHITARQPSPGVYTSARLKSQGLFSFQYGRIEARMKLPEGPGMWPAFWLLGNNITSIDWPACGELDVMEHIDGSNPQNEGFDWVQGSVHGTGLNGGTQYHPAGFSAAAWHTYGMIWSKGQIQYYIDQPTNVYATFTPATQPGTWPFDDGPQFILLNLAVGGKWPGPPNGTTVFPSEVLVDYVRIYSN